MLRLGEPPDDAGKRSLCPLRRCDRVFPKFAGGLPLLVARLIYAPPGSSRRRRPPDPGTPAYANTVGQEPLIDGRPSPWFGRDGATPDVIVAVVHSGAPAAQQEVAAHDAHGWNCSRRRADRLSRRPPSLPTP
jgi:hypothetical protein